jgi:hypothetical protein
MLPTGEIVWMRVTRDAPANPTPATSEEDPEGAPDVGGLPWHRSPGKDGADGEDGQVDRLIGFTEAVGGIAHSVHHSLMAIRPDHVEIEFGLDIDGSTGKVLSLVADVHAKASIKVKLGWGLGPGGGEDSTDSDAEPERDLAVPEPRPAGDGPAEDR